MAFLRTLPALKARYIRGVLQLIFAQMCFDEQYLARDVRASQLRQSSR